jgi:SAM-dependent methyltransferase
VARVARRPTSVGAAEDIQFMSDTWAPLADHFVATYESLRGRIRTAVLHRHLLDHLPKPPCSVVDVGGGAGNDSIPLARLGYDVCIVDPSEAMLAKAESALCIEEATVRSRVRLVCGAGEEAPAILNGERFGAVLCHGVLLYLDEAGPMVRSLCALALSGAVVSIVTKNSSVLALRPAQKGEWNAALRALDEQREVNALGVETRGDTVGELVDLLERHHMRALAWYGVRVFTDGLVTSQPASADIETVVELEVQASERDPYRQISRLFHLIALKR